MIVPHDSTFYQGQIAALARGDVGRDPWQTEEVQKVWQFDGDMRPVRLSGHATRRKIHAVASADPWFLDTWTKIANYIGVPDGWDGYSAPAPSREALDTAFALAALISSNPSTRLPVFSVDSAGVPGFALRTDTIYLHLTIDRPGVLSWLAVVNGENKFGDEVVFDGATLPSDLEQLLRA